MELEELIRGEISSYLDGAISAAELNNRLPDAWDLDQAGDDAATDLALRAIGYLAGYQAGDRTEDELRDALSCLLPTLEVVYSDPAATRMMEQVDEMAKQRVEKNAKIKLLQVELAEMKIDRNDWKRFSDEAEFRAEEAEKSAKQWRLDIEAELVELRDERNALREALLAWWEPQRHVGNCECRACALTRAALAAPTKEGT